MYVDIFIYNFTSGISTKLSNIDLRKKGLENHVKTWTEPVTYEKDTTLDAQTGGPIRQGDRDARSSMSVKGKPMMLLLCTILAPSASGLQVDTGNATEDVGGGKVGYVNITDEAATGDEPVGLVVVVKADGGGEEAGGDGDRGVVAEEAAAGDGFGEGGGGLFDDRPPGFGEEEDFVECDAEADMSLLRNGLGPGEFLWPDGVVYYTIAGFDNETHVKNIRDSIDYYNSVFEGCVKWVERTDQSSYVIFENSGTCSSRVGRSSWPLNLPQSINLRRCHPQFSKSNHFLEVRRTSHYVSNVKRRSAERFCHCF